MTEYLEKVSLWLRNEAGAFGFLFYERESNALEILRSCGEGRREPVGKMYFGAPLHVIAWGRDVLIIRTDAVIKIDNRESEHHLREIMSDMDRLLKHVAQEFKCDFAVQIVKHR
ncbi:hypothetical protein A3C86_02295 [Candidatus Kaiserbacteria bacterium RIFCSPHIGHO2_02_FULL_49_16]|uniref:Uncharacterized protein n=1 Tax=Candidatus Kaiserbacteria bacterium RIFCSPHIGHO2_02_FULL_49_16 TaxID=1798490 RepID=A0A1F6D991_9BACT|nr:MAG: hypothetical protein A3C86_02295 [Candidatus Kaiserbacteria bacterium RIFCSPHIGHO2_02_FULL_49_16]